MIGKITIPIHFIQSKLSNGHHRSVRAKKNIVASFFLKVTSISISLLLVPLTISYIDTAQYGIWLTLSSIVGWFTFFDVGLTHGLRNKFAEARANGDNELARVYVSTTYAILATIFLGLWIMFFSINQFLNWPRILNISPGQGQQLSLLAIIVFTYFCLQFVFRIIHTIITANQQPAKSSVIEVSGQVLSLIVVFILIHTTKGSLIKLGVALCAAPLLVLLFANLFFFKGPYKSFAPSLSKVRFSYARQLFNLGAIFFVIQIAGIVQYETANIIIARNFGTTDVTSYNIVYKYFGVLTMVFTIFLAPFWSASTEAFLKKDYQWIENGMKRYNQLNILLFAAGCIMLLFANKVFDLWLGANVVKIDFALCFWAFIFFNVSMFGSKYVNFLNGISALRIQFITSIISPLLYIVVALFLTRYYKMGVYALFIASVIANVNGFLLAPLQYFMIMKKGKRGIWIK